MKIPAYCEWDPTKKIDEAAPKAKSASEGVLTGRPNVMYIN